MTALVASNGHDGVVPAAERPRERLLRLGAAALSDSEVLALLLGTGHRSLGDAHSLARALLARFGDLRSVVDAGGAELAALRGVGAARAAALVAAGELARRVASASLDPGAPVTSSADVHAHFGPLLADEKRELFYALLLDTKNRLIRKIRISEGSLGASLVHPREAFRPAVREAAAAVLFLHNHPSGDPAPSAEDRRVTERLRRAGELLGIPVLDHVVVGRGRYHSFADGGW
jgi:DNA repair protein RadC